MNNKKLFSIMITLIFIIQVYAQTVDKVIIKAEDFRTQQQGRDQEWGCDLHAYLYKNDQPVENDSSFFYEFYHNKNGIFVIFNSGYGKDSVYLDGIFGQKWDCFVRVNGSDFSVVSDTIFAVGKDSVNAPVEVTLLAKNELGENIRAWIWEFTNPHWYRKYRTYSDADTSITKAAFFNNELRTL